MKKCFDNLIIEIINIKEEDIINTSNETYASWWQQDQNNNDNASNYNEDK